MDTANQRGCVVAWPAGPPVELAGPQEIGHRFEAEAPSRKLDRGVSPVGRAVLANGRDRGDQHGLTPPERACGDDAVAGACFATRLQAQEIRSRVPPPPAARPGLASHES